MATNVIEVFADIGCPFTHVGLRRFVQRRHALQRDDVTLWVRSWPLERVNGAPLAADFVAEEIGEIRAQVAPDLFRGFDPGSFPPTSLPALAVAAAAYRRSLDLGERVSLRLRRLLFEEGLDVAAPEVLAAVTRDFDLLITEADAAAVRADQAEGTRRGVIGSPHFFTPQGDFFCPALDVHRDPDGQLRVTPSPDRFDQFLEACLGVPADR